MYNPYDQAEQDRAKALEHELEGAKATIHQAAIRERDVSKQFEVNVHSWYGRNECK